LRSIASERDQQAYSLSEPALAQGYRLIVHDEIDSTNTDALLRAKAGDPGKLWIAAKTQSQGRGRQGRQWASPPGNLYASLLLSDIVALPRAPELGFVVGIALARSLRRLVSDDPRLRIKWPNDILFDGAKLAGILLESARLADGRLACVIGIGVNCASAPGNLPYRATNLSDIVAMPISPQDVLLALSAELVHWLAVWSEGFAEIRREWLALAAGLGAPIKVTMPARVLEGSFRTIDDAGRLLLDGPDGMVAIEAGDVFFMERPKGTLAGFGN
jgi:BirA family biotin operon repressor/biotin-[acetyl-CoA-carboxylase] ligase